MPMRRLSRIADQARASESTLPVSLVVVVVSCVPVVPTTLAVSVASYDLPGIRGSMIDSGLDAGASVVVESIAVFAGSVAGGGFERVT